MSHEWVKVELYGANNDGSPRRYTIPDTCTASKGQLMRLQDGRIASAATIQNCACAGVAAHDKDANDGSTSISCWTDGVFDVTASGPITVGAKIAASAVANQVWASEAIVIDGAKNLGYALEDGSVAEVINVRLKL